MSYTALYGWGPGSTPKTIRNIILITCIISIFCAFVHDFFLTYLGIQSPQFLLSLSWTGLRNWYIWEPISYLFVQSTGSLGISFAFALDLLFNMYILWIMGTAILDQVGPTSFVRFYFIIGVSAGLITLFLMPILGKYTVLAGPTPIILAIITVWTMLHPESELLLFFLFPVKAKWILAGIIGIILLTTLSRLDVLNFMFYFLGIFFGYLYAAIGWELRSPFAFTYPVDDILGSVGIKIRNLFSSKESTTLIAETKSKIYDLHTGKVVLDDDIFMDVMLEKISKFGERSLSWSERNRMKRISEKKSSTHKKPRKHK